MYGRVPAHFLGKSLACPSCKKTFVAASTQAPAAAPASPQQLTIACPHCGYTGSVPPQYAGRSLNCPTCKQVFVAGSDGGGDLLLKGDDGSAYNLRREPPELPNGPDPESLEPRTAGGAETEKLKLYGAVVGTFVGTLILVTFLVIRVLSQAVPD